jgi:hypothetical protein
MANVTVRSPSLIKVQVGPVPNPRVSTIQYASLSNLHKTADLDLSGIANNDVIVYNSASDSFYVTNISNLMNPIDGGLF